MYAEVIVLTYQSPEIDFYTYQIPKALAGKVKIGQLVSVPFGKRNPVGIIIKITSNVIPAKAGIKNHQNRILDRATGHEQSRMVENDKSKFVIKPITSIVLENPILLPYQIELLKFMSFYYMAPMINCLNAMLPEIPKRLSNYQLSSIPSKTRLASGGTNQQSIQTLVLVPSINHLPQTLAQFPQTKNYVVYTGELKPSEKFTAWQKILSGSYDFIFGSRLAIFAPCPNLKKIIIFDEHDSAYKDDRSPYFDTLTVAEKICTLTGAKLEIIDSSPKITTFTNHKNYIAFPVITSASMSLRAKRSNLSVNSTKQSQVQIATDSSSPRNDKTNLPQTKIISLINDRKLGNYSLVSSVLEEIIKRAYAKKLSILLFLNKKIESGSIYCKNCKHQEFAKFQPDTCPNCMSTEIFFNSSNINSLAKEVKKILPGSVINILAEAVKFSTFNSQLSTITIATSSVFYKLIAHKYDLTAHIYADSPLNFNEYNASEEIYTQILNLKKLTKKLLVIQTYNENLPAIKFAPDNNFPAFYRSELSQRKTLNYPPFSALIKIITKGKNQTEAESKSQKLFKELSRILPATSNLQPATILGPYIPVFGSNLSYNITLKLPINNNSLLSREKVLSLIRPLIPRSKDVKMIVEPKNLNQ